MTKLQNQEQWQQHIDAFLRVSQSKLTFCKINNLNYHQFLYWHTKLTKPSGAFIPVNLKHDDTTLAILELPNGQKLKITSLDALQAIVYGNR